MRYIRKTGTTFEANGKQQTKEFIDSCWSADIRRYRNLHYDRSRLEDLTSTLVDEQQEDANGESYCCYCMRKLYLRETDGHRENVTLEHIVPHRIKSAEWETDRANYLRFANLNDRHITICFNGELTEEQKRIRLTRMPYPHFVSYHNLVASCDGTILEDNRVQGSRCCNNNRQERFVLPIFLEEELARGINYTAKGELDYDENIYDSNWFDERHLNLNNYWIKLVRRLWYKISKSEYTDVDIERAKTNKELRQNIIDDIDLENEILSWNESDAAWILLSEYSWFYRYYIVRR